MLDAFSPTGSLFTTALDARPKAPAPAILTRGDSIDRQPVFSPDGARLAFSSDREGDVDLWELEVASGHLRRLPTARGDDWDPAYSPDAKQLLWSSKRTGHYEVWIAASDGTGARQVSADGVDAENPVMTPDGRWIVYASANPFRNGIWKIRPDGTEASRLVTGSQSNPEISPDGRWVSVLDNEGGRLRVVTLADAADVAAFDLPGGAVWPMSRARPASPALQSSRIQSQVSHARTRSRRAFAVLAAPGAARKGRAFSRASPAGGGYGSSLHFERQARDGRCPRRCLCCGCCATRSD